MEAQWKTLAAAVIIRATIDATAGTNEKEQQEALAWLNSQEGRGVIGIFGLILPGRINPNDLRVPTRNVYFSGKNVSRETNLAGHDAGRK